VGWDQAERVEAMKCVGTKPTEIITTLLTLFCKYINSVKKSVSLVPEIGGSSVGIALNPVAAKTNIDGLKGMGAKIRYDEWLTPDLYCALQLSFCSNRNSQPGRLLVFAFKFTAKGYCKISCRKRYCKTQALIFAKFCKTTTPAAAKPGAKL
jgi:hypothetical protein